MKIYFGVPLAGQNQFGKLYLKIYHLLEDWAYIHLNDEILKVNVKEWIRRICSDKESVLKRSSSHIEAMQQADICIFEASFPAVGLGFMIQRAIGNNKSTIVLYYKNNSPNFLMGIDDENLIIKSYNERNLVKVLKEAIEEAKQKRYRRFNFFITPKLIEYIETESKKEGVAKSKFMRDIIVKHMKTKE
jgi:hypothetical protein